MFYTNRVLFLHAPRTGGDWLTAWAESHLTCSVDRHYLKHASRQRILEAIPETAGLEAFTIVRDEEERFQSFLRMAREWQADDPPTYTEEWRQVAAAAHCLQGFQWRALYFQPNSFFTGSLVHWFPFERDLATCVSWLTRTHAVRMGAGKYGAGLAPRSTIPGR